MLLSVRAVRSGTAIVVALPGIAAMLVRTLLPVAGMTQRPFFHVCRIDAEIMLSVLVVVFRRDPVTRAGSVTRQSKILFVNLERVSTNPHTRSVAVEKLLTI